MILSESKFLVMSLVGAAKESESFCLGFLGVLVFLKGLGGVEGLTVVYEWILGGGWFLRFRIFQP